MPPIGQNADVNAKDRWGGTPLRDAVREGHTKVAEVLKAKGAELGMSELQASAELCEYARAGMRPARRARQTPTPKPYAKALRQSCSPKLHAKAARQSCTPKPSSKAGRAHDGLVHKGSPRRRSQREPTTAFTKGAPSRSHREPHQLT